MRNRVVGEEIEWAGGCRLTPTGDWLPVGEVATSKIIKEVSLNYKNCDGTSSIFLPNGARVYNESAGAHLETASPECSSAREALKFDKWFELFVCWAVRKLKEKHDIDMVLYKKNADSKLEGANIWQNTRGCHENYFSEKKFGIWLNNSDKILGNSIQSVTSASIDPEVNYFILFLITRQIFTGAGGIIFHSLMEEDRVYVISPRAHFIDAIISHSSNTGGSSGRPIVHIRNEALSHDDKYFRNHIILGDANMADLSIFLRFGTTSAVIEMLEENFWDRRLCLDNILDAPKLLKAISRDLTLNSVPIRLKNGKSYTVLQIQRKFYKNWQKYIRHTRQGGEKTEIAGRWLEVLDRLEIDDEKLYEQLDWKIKMRLIRNFVDKKSLPLNHDKVINLDRVYHSPDPKVSFYYILKNRPGAQFESLVSESEILEADKTPPENRAKLRAYLKKLFDELGLKLTVNWDFVTFKSDDSPHVEHKICMIDPRLSSMLSLNLPVNIDSIKYLNDLRSGTIVF